MESGQVIDNRGIFGIVNHCPDLVRGIRQHLRTVFGNGNGKHLEARFDGLHGFLPVSGFINIDRHPIGREGCRDAGLTE